MLLHDPYDASVNHGEKGYPGLVQLYMLTTSFHIAQSHKKAPEKLYGTHLCYTCKGILLSHKSLPQVSDK